MPVASSGVGDSGVLQRPMEPHSHLKKPAPFLPYNLPRTTIAQVASSGVGDGVLQSLREKVEALSKEERVALTLGLPQWTTRVCTPLRTDRQLVYVELEILEGEAGHGCCMRPCDLEGRGWMCMSA